MTPVDQNKFYVEGVSRGNCQQAAVASLLDLPLDDVPNFMDAEFFWDAVAKFFKSRGLMSLLVPVYRTPPAGMYYLAYGPSARGVRHACVYLEGELAHDPHFSRSGLIKVEHQDIVIPTALVGRWRHWVATGEFSHAPRMYCNILH